MKKRCIIALLTISLILCMITACGSMTGDLTEKSADTTGDESTEDAENDDTAASISDAVSEEVYEASLPTGVEESSIYVQKIEGLADDFIKGMDVSSVCSEEAAGVKYYNEEGKEEDVFKILADAGINYVRVRVWNDPYDENGNGYGGGDCDVACATELGRRAASYGMKTCVDFHYSDFWADPNKQMAPKVWKDMTIDEKKTAIYDYTIQSLNTILDGGADVGMVQIGNEINYGLAGESSFDKELELLVEAADAVRTISNERGQDIQIVCHFTQVDAPDKILETAGKLADAGVDYDIFGVSYYTYWHGSFDNLTEVLGNLEDQYGVKTCIMETAYMYTDADADGSANSCSEEDALAGYPCSVQGQANNLRDVCAAASKAGALGVFYWEGCWVAPSSDYSANVNLYEDSGAGWASKYAADYDPEDAGKYYGGCSWDNQALFDADGKALASLNTFKYLKYGATGDGLEVIAIPDVELTLNKGDDVALSDYVDAIYNDSSCNDEVHVTWEEEPDYTKAGTYEIDGLTDDGKATHATVKIISPSYITNGDFEETDTDMWVVESTTGEDPTDVQNKAADAHSGNMAFHWWSESDQDFTVSQTSGALGGGSYAAEAFIQGGDVGDADIYMTATVCDADGKELETYISDKVNLTGWVVWENPKISGIEVPESGTVTVTMHIKCAAGGWGTFDDVSLMQE